MSSQDHDPSITGGRVKDAPSHTPGPWESIPYGDGDSLVIHSGRDWRVCFMATPGESPGAMATIEANARLIAAAPALLEALMALRAATPGTATQKAARKQADTAIAKALGSREEPND